MRGQNILIGSILLSILLSISAIADEASGRTADGCSYKVINGQYLTSCPGKGHALPLAAASPLARDQAHHASAAPVTSYSDVPIRRNVGAVAPALPPLQPVLAPGTTSVSSAIERPESADSALDSREDARRERLRNKLADQTYAGLVIGASNVKESNSGSATGIGLDIGTNISDTFGVEIGYTYANQKLNLGLASRGMNVDQGQQPNPQGVPLPANDSSLTAHLFTGEVQAHLTDLLKRLRPFVGAGLGWKSSTLTENPNSSDGSGYGQTLSGGSLHQNSLGGLASAGTKLRITKALQLGFTFRYFFPLTRQDARIEQPVGSYNNPQGPAETKLTRADDMLTGSSQYQALGGLQYSF